MKMPLKMIKQNNEKPNLLNNKKFTKNILENKKIKG